jgi:hypothetical protein
MQKCPSCGSPAYVGLSVVECGNPRCKNYRNAQEEACGFPPGPLFSFASMRSRFERLREISKESGASIVTSKQGVDREPFLAGLREGSEVMFQCVEGFGGKATVVAFRDEAGSRFKVRMGDGSQPDTWAFDEELWPVPDAAKTKMSLLLRG